MEYEGLQKKQGCMKYFTNPKKSPFDCPFRRLTWQVVWIRYRSLSNRPLSVPTLICKRLKNILNYPIERLDQGHLYPLGERRDKHVTGGARNSAPPAPQADALPKELSRQLISWLFGTSTWTEAGAAFGPLQPIHNLLFLYSIQCVGESHSWPLLVRNKYIYEYTYMKY